MALSGMQKAGWGLADMGIVTFVVVKQLLVLAFLTNYLGVPIATAGLLTTGILLFDIITDPIIGSRSDRTESRFGRRAPWMFWGAVVMSAGMILIFAVPDGLSSTTNMIWVAGAFALATIGFTMCAIPYGAMAGEMTQDPKERSGMTAWRMGFASIGILIGGALIPQLAGSTKEGHFFAAVLVTPLIIGAIWLSLLMTRKAPRIDTPTQHTIARLISIVLTNKTFVTLTILYGIMTLAIAVITAGLPFAALYLILDNGQTVLSGAASGLGVLSLMFACFVVGSILSQALWVFASNRLGKSGALVFGLCLYIVLLFVLFFNLPNVNVTTIAGLFVLAGFTNGAYQQIPWAMYPDLMDVTRKETGDAIEGAFSAVWLFGQKVANAIAPLVLALILGMFNWQETTEGKVEQTEEAIEALRVSITIVPAGILALAIAGLLIVYRPRARKILAQA